MKKIIQKLTASALLALMAITCISTTALAASVSTSPLPDAIVVDGREFAREESSDDSNVAVPDNKAVASRATYKLTGSSVSLYTESNPHGHGPEQFSHGWVQTTAPKFYARAEVKRSNKTIVSALNKFGKGTVYSTSPLAGYNSGNQAKIFYGW